MVKSQMKNLKIAQIMTPLPVFEYLDYKIPDNMTCHIGDYVKISIGSRFEIGIVSHLKETSEFKKLKSISQKFDLPPLSHNMVTFIQKVSAYTMAPIGDILKAVLRGTPQNGEILTEEYLRICPEKLMPLTPKRQEIIDFLAQNGQTYSAKACRAQFSAAIIREMIKKGQIDIYHHAQSHDYLKPNLNFLKGTLSQDQQKALKIFKQTYMPNEFIPFLLDGVTGSGKTELYLEIMRDIWRKNINQQILILIPEIGLVQQTTKRYLDFFGVKAAIWHSQMSIKERQKIRQGVIDGSISCVIGARSGLFLPFKKLGMIIIDEEHDSAYKQEEGFRYHARDMAVMRAKIFNITIILASATPSLESYVNAETGRYHKLILTERFGDAILPDVHIIDLKHHPLEKNQWLAPPLQKAIMAAAFRGEQSLLFLNRRGYAPLMLCQGCGYRIECPFCAAWVVYHRQFDYLKCHQCGQTSELPQKCCSCGAVDKFTPCGPGVERIYEEIQTVFPHLRSVILSSDYLDNSEKLAHLLEEIRAGHVHILVGTQMITKGHHFPHLTCVGIIDADLGLKGGDYRAFERSFQILEQVSGRAGRQEKKGHVYVQTYHPTHPVMQALSEHDRDSFLEYEAQNRLEAQYPPFGRLAALVLSSESEQNLIEFMRLMVKNQPNISDISVLGPAAAPIFMLRGRYRYRFLIKSERHILPQSYIRHWLSRIAIPKNVRLHIDIDPINFL